MPDHPNPHYDPNWQDEVARHNEAILRWSAEAQKLYKSEQYAAAEQASKQANDALCQLHASFNKQHKTVREYADWLFRNFPVNSDDATDTGVIYIIPDFSAFSSIEEAQEAWRRITDQVNAAAGDIIHGLPAGQPEGLLAFSDPTTVLVTERFINIPYRPPMHLRVFIDPERDDGSHVCVSPLPFQHTQPSLTNTIEFIATELYREAHANVAGAPPSSRQKGWRSWFFGPKPLPVDPGRLHFYQHDPVFMDRFDEQFSRVQLEFDRTIMSYHSPRWERFSRIPAMIKNASYDAAINVAHAVPKLIANAS